MKCKEMYRYQIELITYQDVIDFCNAATKFKGDVFIVGENMKINAKSFLGTCVAKASWNQLYLETEYDSYSAFQKFIK